MNKNKSGLFLITVGLGCITALLVFIFLIQRFLLWMIAIFGGVFVILSIFLFISGIIYQAKMRKQFEEERMRAQIKKEVEEEMSSNNNNDGGKVQ